MPFLGLDITCWFQRLIPVQLSVELTKGWATSNGKQNWKKTHNLYLLLSCSTDIRFLSIFFLFLMSVRNKNTSAACKTKRRIDRRLVSRPVTRIVQIHLLRQEMGNRRRAFSGLFSFLWRLVSIPVPTTVEWR